MAIKFRYSMQSILQYRESIEDTKKIGLAKANMELRSELECLDQMEKTLEESIEKKLSQTTCSVKDELIFNNHVKNCEKRIEAQKLCVFKAEKKKDEALKELEVATKDRKIMESLGEKEFERFVAEIDAKEAKELDDMVTTRFGREAEAF